MKNDNNLTLIDGVFTPQDAREILLNIFSSKIRFHKAKNFSLKERFGIEDELANKRVVLLREAIEKLESILLLCEKNDESLIIKSEIIITRFPKQDI